MAKKRKKEKAEVAPTEVVEPTLTPTPVATRNLERPKGSIRIVRGRRDAK